jgi:hypothetical protein
MEAGHEGEHSPDSSSLASNSDLKLARIRCSRPKDLIFVEEEFINALKIAKKR